MAERGERPVWTREQIEAWLAGEIHSATPRWATWSSPEARHRSLLVRRTIFRLCPEADDYGRLAVSLRPFYRINEFMSDGEVVDCVEKAVAALMAQSFSAPVSGDAKEEPDSTDGAAMTWR